MIHTVELISFISKKDELKHQAVNQLLHSRELCRELYDNVTVERLSDSTSLHPLISVKISLLVNSHGGHA